MTRFAYLIEPPFNYRDPDGRVTGCDVELARTVLQRIEGHEIEPVGVTFSELLPGPAEGRWRMTTGVFATEARREVATFSRPIWALPDGLLVVRGNPLGVTGYRAATKARGCVLAVVRDQVQRRSAIEFGMSEKSILVFETYDEAAQAVSDGRAHAYASVARAHGAFIDQSVDPRFEVVTIAADEKDPAFGCFGFEKSDQLRSAVDEVLTTYLGSAEHRSMMRSFGFTDLDVDLVLS